MAKSGTKEWYKEKLEAAKDEVIALKQELQELKAHKPVEAAAPEFAIDDSLLSERRRSSIHKFVNASQRYTQRSAEQVLAAALCYVADSARSQHVARIVAQLKHLKGSGLR